MARFEKYISCADVKSCLISGFRHERFTDLGVSESSLSKSAIGGIVGGTVGGALVLGIAAWWQCARGRRTDDAEEVSGPVVGEPKNSQLDFQATEEPPGGRTNWDGYW